MKFISIIGTSITLLLQPTIIVEEMHQPISCLKKNTEKYGENESNKIKFHVNHCIQVLEKATLT